MILACVSVDSMIRNTIKLYNSTTNKNSMSSISKIFHKLNYFCFIRSAQLAGSHGLAMYGGLDPLHMSNVKASCIKGCHYDTQCKNVEVSVIVFFGIQLRGQ
jgi:hypothetical protein